MTVDAWTVALIGLVVATTELVRALTQYLTWTMRGRPKALPQEKTDDEQPE